MRCGQLISPDALPLSASDTVATALHRMAALGLRQYPLAEGGRLSGIVWEEDLLDLDADQPLGTLEPSARMVTVHGDDPFLNAVRACQEGSLDMVPVLDTTDSLLGVVTRDTLFPELARLCGATEPGALIVLGMAPADYSVAEINRIVESNDAVVTHLNTVPGPAGQAMQVHLRLNRADVASIVAAFRRHDYEIHYQPGEDWIHDELRTNLDHLLTYLNI